MLLFLLSFAYAATAAIFVGLQEYAYAYAFATFFGLGSIILAIHGQKMAK